MIGRTGGAQRLLLAVLWLAVLASCGEPGPQDAAPGNGELTATDPVSLDPVDLPSSLGWSEYNRLRDALDNDEVPLRVVPGLEPSSRMQFPSREDAARALTRAIANADFREADRVFASVPGEWRHDLLNEVDDAATDAHADGDYAGSYRFLRYLNVDRGAFWRLDGEHVSGRIVDTGTGMPIVSASISTKAPYEQSTQTDGNGNFRVLLPRQGSTAILVEHADYEPKWVYNTGSGEPISIAALSGETLEIRLGTGYPELTFRGRVVDAENGQPLSGVAVSVSLDALEGEGAQELKLRQALGAFIGETGPGGRFEIAGLPARDVRILLMAFQGGKHYELRLDRFRFQADVEHVVEVPARGVRAALPLVVMGTVTDSSTGEPVANARVSAGGWKAERTDANGRFVMQLDTGKEWQLIASHERYHQSPPRSFASDAAKTLEAEIFLDPVTTGTVLGRAVNAVTGDPIADAVIEIAGQRIRTDENGNFRAEKVEAGQVAVHAAQSGYRAGREALVLDALETAEATLRLEPITTGTITGIVADRASGGVLAGVSVRAGSRQASTGEDGRFLLEEVESGTVDVAASRALYVPGSASVRLEALGTIETRIELDPITWGSVHGQVRDATSGEPLPGAIIRIGGTDVTTDEDGNYLAERVPAGSHKVVAALDRYHDARSPVEIPRDGRVERSFELAPITTGTVRISVHDEVSGDPVAGARVTFAGRDLQTDKEGAVVVREVASGRFIARASARLFEPGSLELVVKAAEETQIDIPLKPVTYGVILGVVTNRTSGAPLVNVPVRIGDLVIRSDAAGTFRAERVPAGRVPVSASLPRYRDDSRTVDLERGTENTVALALDPITTGTVHGIVRNADNRQPLPGATVTIGEQSADTDTSGRFRMENVAAGALTVRAGLPLFEPGQADFLLEAAGEMEVELDLTPVTWGTIRGLVRDAESDVPLADVRVSAGRRQATTDSNGAFELARVAAGEVSVAAEKRLYVGASVAVPLAAGDEETVTLRLQAITWGAVSGVVTDAETGNPLPDAQVVVGAGTTRSDAQGRFHLEKINAGRLRASASKSAYQPSTAMLELAPDQALSITLALDPIKVGAISGQVLDAKTGEPVARARVMVGRLAYETGDGGRFSFTDVRIGNAVVSARHADYANGSASVKVVPADTVEATIHLDLRREDVTSLEAELARSGTIDLYGIYFDSGRSRFKPSSLPTLRAVLAVMKRAPDRRFRIAGHTDADGSDANNQKLSEGRADTVIQWLIDNGVDPGRLEGVGFGESRPAAPNDTEAGKALNRRVQLTFADARST